MEHLRIVLVEVLVVLGMQDQVLDLVEVVLEALA
jgi:hypothetical protein